MDELLKKLYKKRSLGKGVMVLSVVIWISSVIIASSPTNNGIGVVIWICSLFTLFGGLIPYIIYKNEIREREEYIQLEALTQFNANNMNELSGIQFEGLLKMVFTSLGYKTSLTNTTGDFGVDLLITKDKKTIAIQAKRYSTNVGIGAVQEIYAGLRHYNVYEGWVITNAGFTQAAYTQAKSTGIRLIDGAELHNIIIQAYNFKKKVIIPSPYPQDYTESENQGALRHYTTKPTTQLTPKQEKNQSQNSNLVPLEKWTEKATPKQEKNQSQNSKAWYLLPILLSFLGGIIMYAVLRKQNNKMAKRGLILGFTLVIVGFFGLVIIGTSDSDKGAIVDSEPIVEPERMVDYGNISQATITNDPGEEVVEPEWMVDYRNSSIEVPYNELISNPEKYLNKKIHHVGIITDIRDHRVQDCGEGFICEDYEFTVSRHSGSDNYVEPILVWYYPTYPKHETLKEGDKIELYGVFQQLINTKSNVGDIKIPNFDVGSINIIILNG